MAAARSSSSGRRGLPLVRDSDQGGGRCMGAAAQPHCVCPTQQPPGAIPMARVHRRRWRARHYPGARGCPRGVHRRPHASPAVLGSPPPVRARRRPCAPPALGVPMAAAVRHQRQELAIGLVRRDLRAPLATGLVEKHGGGWNEEGESGMRNGTVREASDRSDARSLAFPLIEWLM